MNKTVSKSTMVELVQELEKLPQTEPIRVMIEEAKAGEYHDYKNRKYDCGKMESSNRLMSLGHVELAKRIQAGEFDETADAEDRAMMRNDIVKDANKNGYNPSGFLKTLGL